MEIDSTKNLFVDREYYKTKSETDSLLTGRFRGILSQKDYDKLIDILERANLDTLTFPTSNLMDTEEITIIIYYDGQRKYLKSAEPPPIANDLILFLTSIAGSRDLQKTDEIKDIEQ